MLQEIRKIQFTRPIFSVLSLISLTAASSALAQTPASPAMHLQQELDRTTAVSIAASAPAASNPVFSKSGPMIPRTFSASSIDQPDFRKVQHPQPAPGEKVVVIPLPKNSDGIYDRTNTQVAVLFSVMRNTDACNRVWMTGDIAITPLAEANWLTVTRLQVRPGTGSALLRSCTNSGRTLRPVEIVTDLRKPQPFRDNLVFYVPEEVDVTAEVFRAIGKVRAVAPENVRE